MSRTTAVGALIVLLLVAGGVQREAAGDDDAVGDRLGGILEQITDLTKDSAFPTAEAERGGYKDAGKRVRDALEHMNGIRAGLGKSPWSVSAIRRVNEALVAALNALFDAAEKFEKIQRDDAGPEGRASGRFGSRVRSAIKGLVLWEVEMADGDLARLESRWTDRAKALGTQAGQNETSQTSLLGGTHAKDKVAKYRGQFWEEDVRLGVLTGEDYDKLMRGDSPEWGYAPDSMSTDRRVVMAAVRGYCNVWQLSMQAELNLQEKEDKLEKNYRSRGLQFDYEEFPRIEASFDPGLNGLWIAVTGTGDTNRLFEIDVANWGQEPYVLTLPVSTQVGVVQGQDGMVTSTVSRTLAAGETASLLLNTLCVEPDVDPYVGVIGTTFIASGDPLTLPAAGPPGARMERAEASGFVLVAPDPVVTEAIPLVQDAVGRANLAGSPLGAQEVTQWVWWLLPVVFRGDAGAPEDPFVARIGPRVEQDPSYRQAGEETKARLWRKYVDEPAALVVDLTEEVKKKLETDHPEEDLAKAFEPPLPTLSISYGKEGGGVDGDAGAGDGR